jgi:ABC-type branched-subunit amino acid transport system substrate-binding protein
LRQDRGTEDNPERGGLRNIIYVKISFAVQNSTSETAKSAQRILQYNIIVNSNSNVVQRKFDSVRVVQEVRAQRLEAVRLGGRVRQNGNI